MSSNVNWAEAIQPLLKKYKDKQHPLEYKNIYQLVVMVVLSAQDSDRNITPWRQNYSKRFRTWKLFQKRLKPHYKLTSVRFAILEIKRNG